MVPSTVEQLVASPEPPARRARRPAPRYVLLAATVLCSVLLVGLAPRHALMSVGLVIGATVGCAGVAVLERRRPALGVRPVVVGIAVVFAVAVALPPRSSNDLWSYTMYGRTVSVHGASPYAHDPADYPKDPFLRHVSPIWRHRSSVFGPLWVADAAIGTTVAGDSVLASRLYFQLTAAAAAAAALALVWRRTRNPAALVWLGLHPVFGAVAVNGGHNDLVIGLALLVAVLVFARRRPLVAGVVVGLAALVKLTALLALVGFVVWSVRHARRRWGLLVVGGAAGTVALGYLPVIASAWHVLSRADRTVTPASLWNPFVDVVLGHNSFRDVPHPLAANSTLLAVSYASLAVVGGLAVVVGWRVARARSVAPAVGTAVAAYPFGAEYTFPWYGCWALPSFAEAGPSPIAWVVWVQSAAMLAALKLPIHWQGTPLDGTVRVLLTFVTPVVMLVLFVGAGWARDRPRTGSDTANPTSVTRAPRPDATLHVVP